MGVRGSTLIGKAQPDERLLHFTSWDMAGIIALKERHAHDLGHQFALGVKQFAMLLELDENDAKSIFREVFDTDRNSLVDSFEIISCLAMLSMMSIKEKVDFIYSLYDFNGSGDITMDEMTILMRTLVTGCAKMDKKISPPSTEEVERLTVKAFNTADKDADGEISKYEFDEFCFSHPMCKDFLDYWCGNVNQVVLADKEVFVDAAFPPAGASLYENIAIPPSGMLPVSTVEWLRPNQFCPDTPTLFSDGPLANRFCPGPASNKWFLSALHIVASNFSLIKNLFVHTGQEDHGRYCFKFFKEGTWVNAVVDDYLPFNRMGLPLFTQGEDRNEIWAMLVEKAYAKIHGGYESIIEGTVEYALRDLTGGIATANDTNKDPKFQEKVSQGKFWLALKKELKNGVVGCSSTTPAVVTNDVGDVQVTNRMGIVIGLGYSVLETLEINEKRLKLIKIGNPWGTGDFTGDWGNTSPLWEEDLEVARAARRNPKVVDSSSFWMTQSDFVRIFNVQYFCKVLPEEWQTVRRTSTFPANGGGCVNFPTWVQNEQILIDVEDDTEVVVTLTQEDDLYHKDRPKGSKISRPYLGVICHRHNFGDVDLGSTKKLMTMRSSTIELMSSFSNARDVTMTGELPIGQYAVVPQTFDPDAGCKYWITVQSRERINIYAGSEIDFDKKYLDKDLEGDNEMEQDLAKASAPHGHGIEEANQIVALQAASKMIADLTIMARDLREKKISLEKRVQELVLASSKLQ
ncbi:hypothetical protein TrCOL_g1613 [Triparma columacea]|uniref:Calmodulin n=1 Tax=Triparma columacea TaxID=722753 RepID=A0A9W7LEH2_9STRA|nr:hypothetical protein TrCOL_g1613 [Triparma columacea]